ncbi:hypothetical protein JTE90_012091 [Oedothorax gibbosus]|uniref:Uncharacterized protein n=1 Tax=Oedothorax gibbosus TaxID=931172 RepID=A0AAV6UKU6_9ARAC|nr:hypothetical protein JTE90_012091 [Oedothorax gibbosus]
MFLFHPRVPPSSPVEWTRPHTLRPPPPPVFGRRSPSCVPFHPVFLLLRHLNSASNTGPTPHFLVEHLKEKRKITSAFSTGILL